MRKTKIVCTLGLVSNTPEVIEKLIDAGMNVARFNFSHGTHESHKQMYDVVKELREKKKLPIATLMDTKGPEVRLGDFADGPVTLREGQEFTLTTDAVMGNEEKASVSFAGLPDDVEPGTTLLLDDGLIELQVCDVRGGDIRCKVMNGGPISSKKSLNVPNVSLSQAYVSDNDRSDILFAIETGFDFIAASFVRGAQDVFEIRQILSEQNRDDIRIIAKIENAEGVRNIDEILRASDGIMVARGDLGVEVPFEEIPSLQKMLISKAYNAGKIAITATQMLESMTVHPRPTRAESTDVANAIYDGTSAVMLSGETASGKYPVKAVETMARIAVRTERDINYRKRFEHQEYLSEKSNFTSAISHATCMTAFDLGASAIIVVTLSGHSARRISKFRPDIPIVGCTVSERTYRQMAMSWGVLPIMIREENDLDQLCAHAVESAMNASVLASGDIVVITAGVPLGMSGSTNLLKVQIAGHVLARGHGLGNDTVTGALCVAHSAKEALQTFREGDILVVSKTSNELLDVLRHAKAVITEEDGANSHAAIVGLTLDIPVIVGAENAVNLLKSGTIVTVDASHGTVSNTESLRANR